MPITNEMPFFWIYLGLLTGFGFAVWYFCYGVECFINGGSIGRNQYTMPFSCLWQEITWVLPGGWDRKLKQTHGNIELAESLPGFTHFVCKHIIFFIPAIVFAWYY